MIILLGKEPAYLHVFLDGKPAKALIRNLSCQNGICRLTQPFPEELLVGMAAVFSTELAEDK